ncbi:hypothetical protein AT864_02703 [Anoxybacillus sp. P3H1B]|uniref:flagellar protein n=1 Tax=Anoxybacillus sp. P3H1B TaxID=1769293 RepID=UPI000793E498|nr:flagellar protein [Anoxybacillus sp. P3H1B]KXG09019.1 hypothetical protein AT864_02703 [Anoxybacillus sp. P3H1B]
MDLVEQLMSCSKKLLAVLENPNSDRDQQVDKVVELLNEREEIIVRLKGQTDAKLKKRPQIMEILQMEQDIQKKIHHLYEQIKNDLKRWNGQKRLQNVYNRPFSHVETYDGRFYDKRK